jgi:hypothetical protein
VNSANVGPYGDAVKNELIPAIEKQFRANGPGWACLATADRRAGGKRSQGAVILRRTPHRKQAEEILDYIRE